MAEAKKYLDYAGLKIYDEKIKALIKTAGKTEEEIKAIIAEVVGALPEDATEETILAYLENKITAVDNKIGDISNLTSETVTNLAGALSGEIDRAVAAEKELQDKINKLEAGDDGELAKKVATLSADITTLKEEIAAFTAISNDEISSLFTTTK
jgi:phage host-nuclease inhibitor protein Gam